jgi:nucleotide-binding universal stress UspA family protein
MFHGLDRILIAVDDGPASQVAIQHGLGLAAAEHASVVFVHVTTILGQDFLPNGSKVNRVPDRGQTPSLRAALAAAAEAGVTADSELLVGYAPEQIAALAEALDVDLVVVGSHHFTGAKRLMRGSTSRALLDATRRPLMVVTEPAPEPAHA